MEWGGVDPGQLAIQPLALEKMAQFSHDFPILANLRKNCRSKTRMEESVVASFLPIKGKKTRTFRFWPFFVE